MLLLLLPWLRRRLCVLLPGGCWWLLVGVLGNPLLLLCRLLLGWWRWQWQRHCLLLG
jgi:hypothetical protein